MLVEGVRLDAPRSATCSPCPATGAYCFTMANNYNGNRRIPVVFAGDGEARRSCAARPGTTCWRATWTESGHGAWALVKFGTASRPRAGSASDPSREVLIRVTA